MSSGTINAKSAEKKKKQEKESQKAEVKADVAVILPYLAEDDAANALIELDYGTITKAVNDYVERYTIDSRIDEIDYEVSIPQLPDGNATQCLKDALTGTSNKIVISNEVIEVDNDAIADDKVTMTFELSVEENVYIDDSEGNLGSDKTTEDKVGKSPVNIHSKDKETAIETLNPKGKSDIIIKSDKPQLYWENPSKAQLYWENAPSKHASDSQAKDSLSKETKDKIVNVGLDVSNKIGSGMNSVAGSTEELQSTEMFRYTKVGDNGKVYFNKYAGGNPHYKIVGELADNKAVRKLGVAGQVITYGATSVQATIDYKKATTTQEKGKVVGATVGKVGAGTVAGAVAGAATTAVLVTIAGAAGVAAAPVTLVVIAGCSIVAATAASTAAEKYGEDFGGKLGEKGVNLWKDRGNKSSNTKKAK